VGAGNVVEVEVFGSAAGSLDAVRTLPGVPSAVVEERSQAQVLVVRSGPGIDVTASVLGCLNGVPIGRVAMREPTLEDAYVELVGAADVS
jgi:ABC-2 type transport system ATP-binding protein